MELTDSSKSMVLVMRKVYEQGFANGIIDPMPDHVKDNLFDMLPTEDAQMGGLLAFTIAAEQITSNLAVPVVQSGLAESWAKIITTIHELSTALRIYE